VISVLKKDLDKAEQIRWSVHLYNQFWSLQPIWKNFVRLVLDEIDKEHVRATVTGNFYFILYAHEKLPK